MKRSTTRAWSSWSLHRSVAVVLVLLVLPGVTYARPVRTWSWQELAEAASGLLAGRVEQVDVVRKIAEDETPWKMRLLRMSASLRVLRMDPQAAALPIAAGDVIRIAFKATDPEELRASVNGPIFPDLSAGDTLVFPVRGTAPADDGLWELIHDEDEGLLVPCAAEGLPDVTIRTGVDFLRAELAGVYVSGTYSDIHRAGRYLHNASLRAPRDLADLYDLFAPRVGEDATRWVTIATATYCAMPTPRRTVAELRAGELDTDRPRAQQLLASKALQHLPAEGLDDRIIAEAIAHLEVDRWGTAMTLSQNYSHHPTTLRLLTEALEAGRPGAVYVAQPLIKDEQHPLVPAAVGAATRLLKQAPTPAPDDWRAYVDLRAACELIRDYGDDEAFELLLSEIRKAQTADPRHYWRLFNACAYTKNPRLIPICAILIDDARPARPGGQRTEERFCDRAAFELQHITGVDFGMASEQSPEAREAAIEKARAWLRENTP